MQWGCLIWIDGIITDPCDLMVSMSYECGIPYGGQFIFGIFFCGRFWIFVWVPDSMLSCFSAFLLYAFPASLLVCFSALPASFLFCFSAFPASLLFCFCALPASFLFCFSAFPASLLLCFCAFLLLLFYFSLLLLYSLLFKEILIRTPDKKPYMKP